MLAMYREGSCTDLARHEPESMNIVIININIITVINIYYCCC